MRCTTTVTLNDGATRRVVEFALWRIASSDIVEGNVLSESFYEKAWSCIHPAYDPAGEPGAAEHRLMRLASVQSAVRRVVNAPAGELIELPVTPVELEEALRDFLLGVDLQDDLLEELESSERDGVACCREAAAQLLWQLEERLHAAVAAPEFARPPRILRVRRPASAAY